MTTNITIHGEYKCANGCGYECVIGVQSPQFFRRSMRDECPTCGAELELINSL